MQIKFIRGTTAQNDGYTGDAGTISIDTDLNQVRLHDGSTQGGHVIPNNTSIATLQTIIDGLGIADIDGLQTALDAKVALADVGAANGVAPLDATGKVAASYLPSFVDDVLEYADQASFPATGETGKIYVALDTDLVYRWSGSVYVNIAASPGSTDSVAEGSTNLYFTDARARAAISASGDLSYDSNTGVISFSESVNSVNGYTGVVVLDKSDIGLGNVQNYAMATQAEAEAANAADKYMSPLATRQLLEYIGFSETSPGEWELDQGVIGS